MARGDTLWVRKGSKLAFVGPLRTVYPNIYKQREDASVLLICDSTAMAVSVGYNFTLAVTEHGDLYTFGKNDLGQLGLGHFDDTETPAFIDKDVAFRGQQVVMVSAGRRHAACVTSDGAMWAWGNAFTGCLGMDDAAVFSSVADEGDSDEMDSDIEDQCYANPQRVPMHMCGQSPARMVACGDAFTLLLTENGRVYACGLADSGQLGQSNTDNKRKMTLIDPLLFGGAAIGMVVAGDSHCMALEKDGGRLWTWGSSICGQLGHGASIGSHQPVAIPAAAFGGARVVFMDAGNGFSMAVTADGMLWSFGENMIGELGLGFDNAGGLSDPQRVPLPDELKEHGVRMVACGLSHTVVVATNDTVWTFGVGRNLLGIHVWDWWIVQDKITSIRPGNVDNDPVIVVAANKHVSAAVTVQGRLYIWGRVNYHAPNLLARVGRWHSIAPEQMLALAMGTHPRLGALTPYGHGILSEMIFRDVFANISISPSPVGAAAAFLRLIGRISTR